jgi:hypothetical protein
MLVVVRERRALAPHNKLHGARSETTIFQLELALVSYVGRFVAPIWS